MRGVLRVHHREIDAQRLAQAGEGLRHCFAAGASNHVADEQDAHSGSLAGDHAALGRHGIQPLIVGPGRHFSQFRGGVCHTESESTRQSRQRPLVVAGAIAQPVAPRSNASSGTSRRSGTAIGRPAETAEPLHHHRVTRVPNTKNQWVTALWCFRKCDGVPRSCSACRLAGCRSPSPSARTLTPRPADGGISRSICSASLTPRAGSHVSRSASMRVRAPASPRSVRQECAEPPWPVACHPPRACLCRWAPDTETKIPTEPVPEGVAYWPRGCIACRTEQPRLHYLGMLEVQGNVLRAFCRFPSRRPSFGSVGDAAG